jgi:hypothetical protein
MKPRITTRAALLAASLFAVGCESAVPAPTTTSPSPFVAQLAGVWNGTLTLTSAGGGHCVPSTMTIGGTEAVSMAVVQDNVDLTARVASATTGISCNYSGRATLNSAVLDSSSCDSQMRVVTCGDGSIRDLKLIGSSITANVQGGVATGTAAYTYNVFVTGKTEGAGSLVANYTYTASRQ